MNYNQLKTLITNSRTTRRFQKDFDVSLEDLRELVELGRVSSSAKNAQPVKYILVTKKDDVLALARNSTWAGALPEWDQSEDERPSAFILMLNDKSCEGFGMFDAGISLTAINLGANAKGLAICPLASTKKEVCKKLFDIPEHLELLVAIAVGKSVEKVKLTEVKNGDINYFRDEGQTHFVPKRALSDIIIGEY